MLLPGYKTTCKKISVDLIKTTYKSLTTQLLDVQTGKIRCPFCKASLDIQSPSKDTMSDAYVGCFVCAYSFVFNTPSSDYTPIGTIKYRGAYLTCHPIDSKNMFLVYEANRNLRNQLKKPTHRWKALNTVFSIKELLNNLNLLELRLEAVAKERERAKK